MAKKKTKKEKKEAVRKFSQGVSNIPLLGDFTRLFRYPAETGRQIGGLTRYLGSKASGADEQKLREIFEGYQNPMFINQDENRKMTGKAGPFSSLLEGMSAGSEASWFLPYGKVDKLVKPAIAAKMSGKAGSRLVPWLGGKVAEAGIRGPFTGLAASDTSKPGEIPGNIAKSVGTQAAFNVLLGGIGEAGKAIRDSGTRLKTAGLGMAQKGDTTQKMADKLSGAKKMEGLGTTAQGQYDRGVRKLDELTTNKNKALESISPKQVTSMAGEAKNKFEKAIKSALRSDELKNSSAYNNIVKGFKKIGSSADLDDLAIEAGSKVPYGAKDPISTVDKEVYDIARDVIVKTLKSKSKDYSTAKSLIDQVISRSGTTEVTNRAFKEAGGSTLPVLIAQLEMPVQAKSLSSLLASAVGGGQRALGGAMQSPTLQGLGSQAITRGVVGAGQQSVPEMPQEPQSQPQGIGIDNGLQGSGMGDIGPAQGSQLATGNPFIDGPQAMQQQQQGGQTVDMEGLTMALMNALVNGQISSGDAEMIYTMAQSIGGGGGDIFGSGGKTLPASALSKIQEVKEAQQLLPTLTGMMEESGDAFGPITGNIRGRIPWDVKGQSAQATINLVKQIIGKGLEGGVLRKEDEYKYEKILPMLGDTEEVVQMKIDGLEKALQNKYSTIIETYQEGGYDPFSGRSNDYDSWQY